MNMCVYKREAVHRILVLAFATRITLGLTRLFGNECNGKFPDDKTRVFVTTY